MAAIQFFNQQIFRYESERSYLHKIWCCRHLPIQDPNIILLLIPKIPIKTEHVEVKENVQYAHMKIVLVASQIKKAQSLVVD